MGRPAWWMLSPLKSVMRNVRWFAALVILGVCVTAWHLARKIFRIDTMFVVGDAASIALNERLLVKNLLFFPTEAFRASLLSNNPLLKDVRITKKFPDGLLIELVTRKPIAVVSRDGSLVPVDEDGSLVENGEIENLPRVFLEEPALGQALQFIAECAPLAVSEITIHDSTSLRAAIGTTDIYFPQSGDIREKVTTLQTLFDQFRIKGTLPATIDLRFDKPVVTF